MFYLKETAICEKKIYKKHKINNHERLEKSCKFISVSPEEHSVLETASCEFSECNYYFFFKLPLLVVNA